jgi:hypothetical protein
MTVVNRRSAKFVGDFLLESYKEIERRQRGSIEL